MAYLGFQRYPLYQLGLFTLGTCPGGGNSNLWALLLGADVNLSVTMTFVSTLAAIGESCGVMLVSARAAVAESF